MLIVLNDNTSSFFNLAAEEYMMKNFDDDIFMLWRGERSILIGNNQNALKEINYDYVKENNIGVVRRITGGGTVFFDLGNIAFGFIKTDDKAEDKSSFTDFRKFTIPILEVLKSIGVNAEFSGRNDLVVDGMKISGNAQYKYKNRVLHHGALLYSADLKDLVSAINPSQIKYKSKGIDSVKSRVTNINKYLNEENKELDILGFRDLINKHIKNNYNASFYKFTEKDLNEIDKLMEEKYLTYEWNYGKSPKYSSYNEEKFKGGIVEASYEVKNAKIYKIKFNGDFFSQKSTVDIEKVLIGVNHNKEDIKNKLSDFNIDEYFSNITLDEIVSLLF
ncbi:lipoate--protein ligase [Helicovermis profundi]|uniref:lipoate--protein ligase n=1 Tax=Helicovermis profundi TaxID=3065157 RepID=A0AAU9E5J2_9FIRM|nr:lipoate--protein ligase [Clostridia bacterium S502]